MLSTQIYLVEFHYDRCVANHKITPTPKEQSRQDPIRMAGEGIHCSSNHPWIVIFNPNHRFFLFLLECTQKSTYT